MSAQNVCVYVTVTLDSAISYPEICCKNLPYPARKLFKIPMSLEKTKTC